MNKEKLIEEVRRYNFLYDASDAKYADSNKRDQAWKSIAGVLSAPGTYLYLPTYHNAIRCRLLAFFSFLFN